ncbi:MAG: nucleotide exchange factor GrpE [Tepidisphaerales bacterium]
MNGDDAINSQPAMEYAVEVPRVPAEEAGPGSAPEILAQAIALGVDAIAAPAGFVTGDGAADLRPATGDAMIAPVAPAEETDVQPGPAEVAPPVPLEAPPQVVAALVEPAGNGCLSDEVRRSLIQQFEQWLDRMTAGEPLPEGLPEELAAEARAAVGGQGPGPERDCDLYTLFHSVTGLTGEIKLQGRAFKQLADALAAVGEVPGRLEKLEAVQAASVEQLTELAKPPEEPESPLPTAKEALTVLFDLYDRMERGLRTFDAGMEAVQASVGGGLLWRLSGGARHLDGAMAAAKALREGYQLTLSRLEAAMQHWGIEQLGEAGDMFDPQWMTAVDVQTSADVPAGTVLEVYRSGYALHGQVLATAQVKVAKEQG